MLVLCSGSMLLNSVSEADFLRPLNIVRLYMLFTNIHCSTNFLKHRCIKMPMGSMWLFILRTKIILGPCDRLGGQSSTSHHGGQSSIPAQVIWDLRWTK
jgi:hypothetical protein